MYGGANVDWDEHTSLLSLKEVQLLRLNFVHHMDTVEMPGLNTFFLISGIIISCTFWITL